MRSSRDLGLAAIASAALYALFYYVPISAGHTPEVFALRPLGRWSIGSASGLAAFYAAILTALFAAYLLALARLRPADGATRARLFVYAGAAASAAILVFTPSLLSRDVFDYMVQGRILVIHRMNPFDTAAESIPADDFTRAMGWPQYTTLYGPGWISACGLLTWIAPGTLAGSLLVYKVFFGAVHLLNGALVGALLRGWGREPLRGELLYLWNPLVLLQSVGGAHNDGFLVLWVLLGLLFMQRRRAGGFSDDALGAVCLAVSVLVKYVTAPILALVLVVRARERGGPSGWKRAALLGLIVAAAIVVGYLPYAAGMDPLHFLRPYQHGSYQGSGLMLVHMMGDRLITALAGAPRPQTLAIVMRVAGGGLMLGLAALSVVLLYRARDEEDVPRSGLIILLAYLLAATALLRVSYGTWVVALASVSAAGLASRTALLLSGSLFALEVYWVYAIRMMGSAVPLHREQGAASLVALGMPILYLLAGFVRERRRRRAG